MPARDVPDRFLVAFSFAGEQRDLVRAIATQVESLLGRGTVFLDEWYPHYIGGADADLKFQEIYRRRCVLAIVCVSAHYGDKPWTLAEHAAIRDREMRARAATDSGERLGVMPVRVGEGEVEGILFNAVVPDVRTIPVLDAAQLIVARLRLIDPDLGQEAGPASEWPDVPLGVHWPMADHSQARTAFESLLRKDTPCQFLALRGLSETGKTHITRQMLNNALRVPQLACGRFDFKGTTDLDAELRAFVQHLGVPANSGPGARLNERFSTILDALRSRRVPTLLIFDTYEKASGEAQQWIKDQLLLSLVRMPWLRVVIAGQEVPSANAQGHAARLIVIHPPPPEDWLEFGKGNHKSIDLEFVRKLFECCRGRVSCMAQALGPDS